jgi:hypothetical protein
MSKEISITVAEMKANPQFQIDRRDAIIARLTDTLKIIARGATTYPMETAANALAIEEKFAKD